ncbi:murein hydrolase activator EnvC family protein, partial [Anaerosolibacter sp.]|uniref:murein hydrolase activator EnvC family protein n=1 Tax=Anaerosolibacter sp. TaxID=1872527 RepID=UPI0039EE83A7
NKLDVCDSMNLILGGLDLKANRIILIVCTILFTLTFMIDGFAQDVSNEQKKLNQLNQQIKNIKNKLLQNNKKEKSISTEIESVNKKIEQTESEIGEIGTQITAAEEQIKQAKQELRNAEGKIDTKNDTLNSRLRVMYKNGNVGYLQVLFNSSNIVDMLSKLDMVKRVVDHDMELLKFMKTQRDKINNNKKLLENQQANLVAMADSMERKQRELEISRGQMAKIKKDIIADNKKLEKQEDELNRYAQEISSQIRKLQTKEVYKGGKFAWPAPGYSRITSPFGYRIHPILKIKKLHTGMDIAVPTGGKIVAAEAGTVIYSGWMGGYGNTVMVDHGSGLVTLYPHNSKLVAKKGDKVKREQLVAKAGSTGLSTGPHLHFEVRKNGEYVDPKPWLNL